MRRVRARLLSFTMLVVALMLAAACTEVPVPGDSSGDHAPGDGNGEHDPPPETAHAAVPSDTDTDTDDPASDGEPAADSGDEAQPDPDGDGPVPDGEEAGADDDTDGEAGSDPDAEAHDQPGSGTASAAADVRKADKFSFSCGDGESEVAASGAARVSSGDATIYVGTQQVSANNQDPRVVRFDSGRQTWCRDDLETTGDDHRGYGLLWSGDALYAVFSVTGTQGSPSEDFRRFATEGWLTSFSDASPRGGGGPKAAVIARLDPATGDGLTASYLTALTSKGKTNSLAVTSLDLDRDTLVVGANSWWRPRRADRTAMECTGDSPFPTTYHFTADLSDVTSVESDRCS